VSVVLSFTAAASGLYRRCVSAVTAIGPSRRLIWWHSSRQLSVAISVFFWLIVSSFRFCRRRDWVVEAVDLAVTLKSVVGSKSVPVPN
jgi:hypothetical protein